MDQPKNGKLLDENSRDHSLNIRNEIARSAEKNINESLSKILEFARAVDAAKLFVALFANMALGPAEHISEATHGDVPAKLELFAYYIYPLFGKSGSRPLTPWDTQLCWGALDKLFVSRMHFKMFSESQVEFSKHVRMYSEIVRGSAYPEQTSEEILSVQGKFDSWFAQEAGITPSRAVGALWAIMDQIEKAANDFTDDLRDSMRNLGALWKASKQKRKKERSERNSGC